MSTPVYLWRIPDALIGKLEGLKPPRVALVSLHLGAFSFPESTNMTSLSIFAFDSHAVRTVTDDATGEALFVAKDVCAVLGYKDHTTAVRNHCKGVPKQHPLQTPGGVQELRVLTEADVLRLIIGSNMPEAQRFEAWVFEEVLPSIRKTGGYTQPQQASNVFALAMVESMARTLRISDSGVLLMYRQVASVYAPEAVSAIPVYAIDAPTTATSAPASSMPTASLTVLLNEHDIGVSAVTANKMLARAGMLEEMTRPSSKGTVKKFWSVTEAGQKYGKNVTSPSNHKETQPHWYRDTFKELVRLHLVA
jgi:prophage antirepressor-like protein